MSDAFNPDRATRSCPWRYCFPAVFAVAILAASVAQGQSLTDVWFDYSTYLGAGSHHRATYTVSMDGRVEICRSATSTGAEWPDPTCAYRGRLRPSARDTLATVLELSVFGKSEVYHEPPYIWPSTSSTVRHRPEPDGPRVEVRLNGRLGKDHPATDAFRRIHRIVASPRRQND